MNHPSEQPSWSETVPVRPFARESHLPMCGNLRLHKEVSRGLRSVRYEAQDPAFGRWVVVEVLAREWAGDPAAEQRFMAELALQGRLQHPGIQPVYESGRTSDGRPYYTTRPLPGGTLADAFGRKRAATIDSRGLIAIFERVVQALAHAHANHVAHRALSPEAVRLGANGEVQVTSWGAATELSPKRGTNGEATRGEVPPEACPTAWAPPEQARGTYEQMDERSDVFALGAILCQILTGEPPYVGKDAAVRSAATQGRLDECRRRLEACGGPPELIALADACLQASPGARLRNAGELEAHLDRARSAIQQRQQDTERSAIEARSEAHREHRVARKVRTLAESFVLVGLVAAGCALYLHRSEAEQRDEVLAQLHEEVECAQFLWSAARAKPVYEPELWDEALVSTSRVEAILRSDLIDEDSRQRAQFTTETLRHDRRKASERAQRLERSQRLAARLGDVRAPSTESCYRADEARLAASIEAVLREEGLHPERGLDAVAEELRQLEAGDAVLAAIDRWAAASAASGGAAAAALELALAVDPDPSRARMRRAATEGDLEPARAAAAQPAAEAATVRLAADLLGAAGDAESAVGLLQAARDRFPGDATIAARHAAWLEACEPPRLGEAADAYRVVLALRPESLEMRHRLALALEHTGEYTAARRVIDEARARGPQDVHLRIHEGLIAQKLERTESALEVWREAAQEEAAGGADLELLGRLLVQTGDHGGAMLAYQRWATLEPEDARPLVAVARALAASGKDTVAVIDAYRRAIELAPSWPEPRLELGAIHEAAGQTEQAIALYLAGVQEQPRDATLQRQLGRALAAKGDVAGAAVALKQSLILAPGEEAVAEELDQLLRHRMGDEGMLVAALKDVIEHVPDCSVAAAKLAEIHLARGETAAAVAVLEPAVEARPTDARLRALLGRGLVDREPRRALEHLEEAARAGANDPELLASLGRARLSSGDIQRSIQALRAVLEERPDDVDARYQLGVAMQRLGRVEEAVACYAEVVRTRPDHAESQLNLGALLRYQGRYEEALAAFRAGHATGSGRVGWTHPSEQWIAETERLVSMQHRLDAVLRGEAPPTAAEERLALARMAHQRELNGTAAELYASALEAGEASGLVTSRFEAACAAARAAAGVGAQARDLDPKERARWRGVAVDWLEEELTVAMARSARGEGSADDVRAMLQRWKESPELASLRPPLATTASEEERERLESFWADVDTILERLESRKR